MQGVSVQQLAERMKFKCFTPCVDMSKRMIVSSEINRPALELAGYFEHFAEERIQIIGMVEYSYLESAGTMSRMKKCCVSLVSVVSQSLDLRMRHPMWQRKQSIF